MYHSLRFWMKLVVELSSPTHAIMTHITCKNAKSNGKHLSLSFMYQCEKLERAISFLHLYLFKKRIFIYTSQIRQRLKKP